MASEPVTQEQREMVKEAATALEVFGCEDLADELGHILTALTAVTAERDEWREKAETYNQQAADTIHRLWALLTITRQKLPKTSVYDELRANIDAALSTINPPPAPKEAADTTQNVIVQFAHDLAAKQTPLDEECATVLRDHAWDLYGDRD